MNNLLNSYPRGVAIDPERSNTLFAATTAGQPVLWLARSGYLYKTRRDALDDPAATWNQAEVKDTTGLQPGEYLFYHRYKVNVAEQAPESWPAEYLRHFKRVSIVETPFVLARHTKPSQASTIWVSAGGRAYATCYEATANNPKKALPAATANSNRNRWIAGLILLLAAGLLAYALFNTKTVKL